MTDDRDLLTATELLALKAASHGLTAPEAAVVAGFTYDSLRNHLRNARRKLRAKTTAQAVAHALRQGLIP